MNDIIKGAIVKVQPGRGAPPGMARVTGVKGGDASIEFLDGGATDRFSVGLLQVDMECRRAFAAEKAATAATIGMSGPRRR